MNKKAQDIKIIKWALYYGFALTFLLGMPRYGATSSLCPTDYTKSVTSESRGFPLKIYTFTKNDCTGKNIEDLRALNLAANMLIWTGAAYLVLHIRRQK